VVEKSHIKTKPATAKNALAVSFLALKALMQVDEILQNKNNLVCLLELAIYGLINPQNQCLSIEYNYRRKFQKISNYSDISANY
jgi:hypothetical protein